ncbi:4-amino-4-deoxy-L-arabinose-phosphoundecaprenol flippase subunit ArnE [uncultured archaeon]|nr:4-amino-4-deoxy-L-arabinose-phosphoundecaprenol flippase subunit ArnE [uncultured archaeon]
MNAIVIIIIGIIFSAFGQVSWKLGMNQAGQLAALNFTTLSTVLLNPYVLLGFVMYGLSTIFWLIALSKKDLSFVYPFISLTYLLVLVLSSLVLKESIGLNKLAGTLAIVIGLVIISRA